MTRPATETSAAPRVSVEVRHEDGTTRWVLMTWKEVKAIDAAQWAEQRAKVK